MSSFRWLLWPRGKGRLLTQDLKLLTTSLTSLIAPRRALAVPASWPLPAWKSVLLRALPFLEEQSPAELCPARWPAVTPASPNSRTTAATIYWPLTSGHTGKVLSFNPRPTRLHRLKREERPLELCCGDAISSSHATEGYMVDPISLITEAQRGQVTRPL